MLAGGRSPKIETDKTSDKNLILIENNEWKSPHTATNQRVKVTFEKARWCLSALFSVSVRESGRHRQGNHHRPGRSSGELAPPLLSVWICRRGSDDTITPHCTAAPVDEAPRGPNRLLLSYNGEWLSIMEENDDFCTIAPSFQLFLLVGSLSSSNAYFCIIS